MLRPRFLSRLLRTYYPSPEPRPEPQFIENRNAVGAETDSPSRTVALPGSFDDRRSVAVAFEKPRKRKSGNPSANDEDICILVSHAMFVLTGQVSSFRVVYEVFCYLKTNRVAWSLKRSVNV